MVFEAMDASETPGTRGSVDACEVKLDITPAWRGIPEAALPAGRQLSPSDIALPSCGLDARAGGRAQVRRVRGD